MLGVWGGARYNDGMDGGKTARNDGLVELNNFVAGLKKDFAQLRFREGRKFAFRPPRTIILEPVCESVNAKNAEKYRLSALHEVGHALLGHKFYTTDPERLRMESEAWAKARELCLQYNIVYDTDYAEGELDTYREWLHRRSHCPECGLTRYQTKDGEYHCPGCENAC